MLAGCWAAVIGGAGAGAGTVAYIKGELKSHEGASLERTWEASISAVDELGYILVEKEKDAASGKLVVKTSENKKVRINLKYKSSEHTELGIRVGVFGDEKISKLILKKIQERLY